jgi:hypothetical protein
VSVLCHLSSTENNSPTRVRRRIEFIVQGTSRIFRGTSALESESEMTEPPEFDTFTDEIRRWSSVSEDECQRSPGSVLFVKRFRLAPHTSTRSSSRPHTTVAKSSVVLA